MLVVAKKPRIRVEISGKGVKHIVKMMRDSFGEVKVEDDETIPIKETSWYKKMDKEMTPGDALWCYRDNAELSLVGLSKKTGIAVSHLSAMENGKRNIGKITAKRLGKALSCDYRRFL